MVAAGRHAVGPFGHDANAPLQVNLLGGLTLMCGREPAVPTLRPRLRALVAYLILHRDAPQSRDRLAMVLWPDTLEAQARTNLRNLLFRLREALPVLDPLIAQDRHALRLRTEEALQVDVDQLTSLVAIVRAEPAAASAHVLVQAADRFAGELLPEIYDDWVVSHRERVRGLQLEVLDRTVAALARAGDFVAAAAYSRRLIDLSPLDEPQYRRVMRLHAAAGNRAGIEATLKLARETLQEELGAEPSTATCDLARELCAAAGRGVAAALQAGPSSAAPPGRGDAWDALSGAWAEARRGTTTVVVVPGEAGIGKTHLVEAFAAHAEAAGECVARAACRGYGEERRYGVVYDWLRSPALREAAARMLPAWPWLLGLEEGLEWERGADGVRGGRGAQGRRHADRTGGDRSGVAASAERFEAWARVVWEAQPLLLVLDDFHLADTGSLAWLDYLLGDPRAGRIMALFSIRGEACRLGEDAQRLLRRLSRMGRTGPSGGQGRRNVVEEVALGGLPPEAVASRSPLTPTPRPTPSSR